MPYSWLDRNIEVGIYVCRPSLFVLLMMVSSDYLYGSDQLVTNGSCPHQNPPLFGRVSENYWTLFTDARFIGNRSGNTFYFTVRRR